MPKDGQGKVVICPNCGNRSKVIWTVGLLTFEGYWKGYCPKCGNLIEGGEDDATKVEGQI